MSRQEDRKFAVPAGIAAAVLATGVALAPASAAQASSTAGPVTVNCGIVTCSAYLSRSATKAANEKITVGGGAFAGLALVVCAPLMTPPLTPIGVACGAAAAVQGPWIAQEIGEAATRHGDAGACLKVTYTRTKPPVITYWSTNNGQYCKD